MTYAHLLPLGTQLPLQSLTRGNSRDCAVQACNTRIFNLIFYPESPGLFLGLDPASSRDAAQRTALLFSLVTAEMANFWQQQCRLSKLLSYLSLPVVFLSWGERKAVYKAVRFLQGEGGIGQVPRNSKKFFWSTAKETKGPSYISHGLE